MGITSRSLCVTALLLGVLLLSMEPVSVSAQTGYCSSTKRYDVRYPVNGYYTYSIPYPVYRGSTNCIMNIGAEGAAVRSLQTTLNKCYGQYLVVDGKYGPLTKAAVRVAQRRAGTTADGIYGPKTGSVITWYGTDRIFRVSKCVKVGRV